MEVEIPAIQNTIINLEDTTKFITIGVILGNVTEFVQTYKHEKNISFPLVSINADDYPDYEVGWMFGNLPPCYFIINREGIIENRFDIRTGIIPEIRLNVIQVLDKSYGGE